MNLISKALAAATMIATFSALPSTASAERVYYLVGVRHIYRIGVDRYFHVTERKQIEEDYADEVSADNAHYQYQISHGADANQESAQLQSALHDLAVERDQRLSALYQQCDWVRKRHSCWNLKVDGPYQVIGVDYHEVSSVEVYDDYVCYAPWPGYVCEGPPPYGWSYGVVYNPGLFLNVYNGWYGGWVGFGCPAYVGFYGYGGPVVVAGLSINIGLGFGIGGFYGGFGGVAFYSNPRLGGFYHAGPGFFGHDPFRGGYIAGRGDPRAFAAGRAGYAVGAAAIRSARAGGYAAGIRAGSRSSFAGRGVAAGGFARSAGTGFARGAGGYAHSFARTGSTPRAGSFARSSGGARGAGGYAHTFGRSTGSARSGGVSRNSGSFARSSGGTRSHSGGGSFSHSSGSSRSFGGGRSSGGGRSFGGGHSSGGSRSLGGGHSFGGSRSFGGGHPSGGGRSFGGSRSFGGGRPSSGGGRSFGGGRPSGGGGRRHGG